MSFITPAKVNTLKLSLSGLTPVSSTGQAHNPEPIEKTGFPDQVGE
jgi:hypothetical protein